MTYMQQNSLFNLISAPCDVCPKRITSAILVGFSISFAKHSLKLAELLHEARKAVPTYIKLPIVYLVFVLSCILTPKYTRQYGPKISMLIGYMPYLLYTVSHWFQISWTFVSIMLLGFGFTLIWVGSSLFLLWTCNKTEVRYTVALFWAIIHLDVVDVDYAIYVLENYNMWYYAFTCTTLSCMSIITVIVSDYTECEEACCGVGFDLSIYQMLKDIHHRMFLLIYLHSGFMYSMHNVQQLGIFITTGDKNIVNAYNTLFNMGNFLTAICIICVERVYNLKIGQFIFIGLITDSVSTFLMFVNCPPHAHLGNIEIPSIAHSSNVTTLITSFLHGVTYACINTQIYSMIAVLCENAIPEHLVLYKLMQCTSSAFIMIISSKIGMYPIICLHIFSIAGAYLACCFYSQRRISLRRYNLNVVASTRSMYM